MCENDRARNRARAAYNRQANRYSTTPRSAAHAVGIDGNTRRLQEINLVTILIFISEHKLISKKQRALYAGTSSYLGQFPL